MQTLFSCVGQWFMVSAIKCAQACLKLTFFSPQCPQCRTRNCTQLIMWLDFPFSHQVRAKMAILYIVVYPIVYVDAISVFCNVILWELLCLCYKEGNLFSEPKLSLNLKIQWLQSSIKTATTFVKFKLPLSKISTFLDTIAIEVSNNIKFKALF